MWSGKAPNDYQGGAWSTLFATLTWVVVLALQEEEEEELDK